MHKKDSQVISVFFALLGPTTVKAARKMLVKLTPNRDKIELMRDLE